MHKSVQKIEMLKTCGGRQFRFLPHNRVFNARTSHVKSVERISYMSSSFTAFHDVQMDKGELYRVQTKGP